MDTNKMVPYLSGQAPHRGGLDRPPECGRASLSYRALRIANIYTPLEEIDTFVDAMRGIIKTACRLAARAD
ncbi:MAG: hypothetical protein R2712_02015 [Vicinamibacterales bacterium]